VDYKDEAHAECAELFQRAMVALKQPGLAYAKRRAIALALRAMPDGGSCPREFLTWDSSVLVAAIAATK